MTSARRTGSRGPARYRSGLVPRGIVPLSDIHHFVTDFDRVEHAGNSNNMGTRDLEETVIEGDVIAARFTMRGTHRGAFFGVPPTGKTIAMQALNIYRLRPGRSSPKWGNRTCSD
jgi:predicted ester cyclase